MQRGSGISNGGNSKQCRRLLARLSVAGKCIEFHNLSVCFPAFTEKCIIIHNDACYIAFFYSFMHNAKTN
jgi:hypothetical protein